MKRYTNLSKDEIIKLYKESKHKETQVRILAELTASDTETILEILKDAGVYNGAYMCCPKCGRKYPALSSYSKTRQCIDCRERSAKISNLKHRLKKNAAKMQEIQRWNVKYRAELDRLELELEHGLGEKA